MALHRFIVMLGTDLRSPGGMTAVVQAYKAGGLFEEWPVRYLATYHRAGAMNKLWTAALALVRFCAWVAAGQVCAVHAHVAARGSFWRKSVFLLIGSAAGARTVFHLHDGSFPAWYASRGGMARRIVRWVLRRMDCVVVLTQGWRVPIANIEPRARLAVLPNPVILPMRRASPVASEVLFLARLWREKGIYDLLAAAATLRGRVPDLHLICAGDGDLVQVQEQAQQLGLADKVTLPGWVAGEAKDRLFERACVFVLPSHAEGLPMGVLEAMAWGVPVIAANVGGIPEALGTEAGVMFAPGDVAALATHLEHLLADAVLRRRLGAAGQRRAAEFFGSERVLTALGALYAQLGQRPIEPSGVKRVKDC